MKLKRLVSTILTAAMLLGTLVIVPATVSNVTVEAASLLSAAKKNGTAKAASADQLNQIKQKFAGFVCWGDSLTAGVGESGASYPYRLGEYIDSNLIKNFSTPQTRVNYGVGGENVQSICARANVAPATLRSAITIPASGSVSISLGVVLFGQDGGGYNYAGITGATGPKDATINGVAGTLSGSGTTLTFTRKTAGSAVSCAAGTQVILTSGNLYDNQNYIPIVYMGYNSGPDWCNSNFEQYTQLIDKIINKYPMGRAGRYIVICPHFTFAKVDVTKQIEAKMAAKYGNHLIKTREFMCNYGLSESGVAAKSGDQARIAAGKIPSALMASDDVHFNGYGNDLLTRMVYQKAYDLGYFNEIISILGINITPGSGGGGDTPVTPPSHTHTPGAAATCTTPQKCTSCQQVIVAALGHNYVNGKCSRCGAADPSAAAAYTTSVNESCNTALSQKYNFDLYAGTSGYGIGKLSFAQCVDRAKVSTAASAKKVEASVIGAYMTRGVLLDSNAGNTGMSWLTTAANGSERVYANGVVNGDVPYVVYKVKSTSGSIDTVSVKVNAGNINNFRGAVYVTDNLGYNQSSGQLNFSSFKFLGVFEGSGFSGFYPESEAKVFNLASGQISGKSELYVVVALSNFAEAAIDAERLSGVNTTNARVTAIQIEATTSGSAPVHTHTPGAAATCTTPQTCTGCGVVLNAAKGHSYGNTYSSDASGHWTTCISCGAKDTVSPHVPNVNEATTATAKYCVMCQYVIEPKKQETHNHTMEATPAKAATCKSEGNIAYWYCTGCKCYFSDAQGNNQITYSSTIISKSNHTYGTVYSSDESGHWTTCTVCGAKNTVQPHIPNASAATETTDKYCVICKYVIEEKKPQTTDEVYGDADGNGEFTIDDVSYLLNYFLFGDMSPEIYVVHQNMDYNKDGSVTIDDVSVLLNYILFGTV